MGFVHKPGLTGQIMIVYVIIVLMHEKQIVVMTVIIVFMHDIVINSVHACYLARRRAQRDFKN